MQQAAAKSPHELDDVGLDTNVLARYLTLDDAKQAALATLEDFLNTPQFCMEKREVLQAAIDQYKTWSGRKAGPAHALIAEIAASACCTTTMTLDKAAVRAAGITLLS